MGRGTRRNRTHLKKRMSNDGLYDALSNIGGEKDILTTGVMGNTNYITRNQTMLQRMYRSNIWVKKAVAIPANYAVKGWRKISDEKFEAQEQRLRLKTLTSEALTWSFLFGGSMAVFIVDDGLPPSEPLNLNNVKENSFKRIIIVDRWKVTSETIDSDPLSDTFGEPPLYRIQIGDKTANYHPSRCHRFVTNDLPIDEARHEQYWGVSTIEIIYRQLISDDVFLSSVANMMKKATTDIMGIPNLSQMIKNGHEEAVKTRVRLAQSTMSTLNAWVKDNGANGQNAETYDKITQQFSGFDAMDIQSQNRIVAAADIPASIFLGRQESGLSNDGSSSLNVFNDRLSSIREIVIDPFLRKTDMIIAATLKQDTPIYEWENPFPMTRKEEAEIRNINADVITKMQTMQVSDEVIANKLLEFDLIDEDEHKIVVDEFSLEPYDIEEETTQGEDL